MEVFKHPILKVFSFYSLQKYFILINIKLYYSLDLEHIGPLVSEEKVIFGLNARAVSQLTLAKIRKIYSRVDSKSIAKQVNFLNFLYNTIIDKIIVKFINIGFELKLKILFK